MSPLHEMKKAAKTWQAGLNASQVSQLSGNEAFNQFLQFAKTA